jgi:hypothetical protein
MHLAGDRWRLGHKLTKELQRLLRGHRTATTGVN